MKIKYLVMDVDGTLTDGKIYMGQDGEVMKAFSVKDGYAINHHLKDAEIVPIIITARESKIVEHRCKELGIAEVYQGKSNKYAALLEIVGEENLGRCACFGDDILDLRCMEPIKQAGGIVGCPADAMTEVIAFSDYICLNKAGEGALREFVEWMIKEPKLEILTTFHKVEYHKGFYACNNALREVETVKLENAGTFENTTDFVDGLSQFFAMALNTHFGYDIYVIEGACGALDSHVFCKVTSSDNKFQYIDVRGVTTDFIEFLTGIRCFAQDRFELRPASDMDFRDWRNDAYYDVGMKRAEEFISRYENFYKL